GLRLEQGVMYDNPRAVRSSMYGELSSRRRRTVGRYPATPSSNCTVKGVACPTAMIAVELSMNSVPSGTGLDSGFSSVNPAYRVHTIRAQIGSAQNVMLKG